MSAETAEGIRARLRHTPLHDSPIEHFYFRTGLLLIKPIVHPYYLFRTTIDEFNDLSIERRKLICFDYGFICHHYRIQSYETDSEEMIQRFQLVEIIVFGNETVEDFETKAKIPFVEFFKRYANIYRNPPKQSKHKTISYLKHTVLTFPRDRFESYTEITSDGNAEYRQRLVSPLSRALIEYITEFKKINFDAHLMTICYGIVLYEPFIQGLEERRYPLYSIEFKYTGLLQFAHLFHEEWNREWYDMPRRISDISNVPRSDLALRWPPDTRNRPIYVNTWDIPFAATEREENLIYERSDLLRHIGGIPPILRERSEESSIVHYRSRDFSSDLEFFRRHFD